MNDLIKRFSPSPKSPNLELFQDNTATGILTHKSSKRSSSFDGLQGFLKAIDGAKISLAYVTGGEVTYAQVGEIFHINHPRDEEINQRVVIIFRTNNDSWSCYSFCRHPHKFDCEKQAFKEEHAKVVVQMAQAQSRADNMNTVVLQVQDGLEVESDLWINCRQILDIKHTVGLAPVGSIQGSSLEELFAKGQDVFNRTYADCDKRYNSAYTHSNAVERADKFGSARSPTSESSFLAPQRIPVPKKKRKGADPWQGYRSR